MVVDGVRKPIGAALAQFWLSKNHSATFSVPDVLPRRHMYTFALSGAAVAADVTPVTVEVPFHTLPPVTAVEPIESAELIPNVGFCALTALVVPDVPCTDDQAVI